MAPNPKEQEDHVPIIINDSLEDDAISWDNTPITGKWHNYMNFNNDYSSPQFFHGYTIFIYSR